MTSRPLSNAPSALPATPGPPWTGSLAGAIFRWSERYYLRALDIESRGERRKGMYEELARGFGVTDIRPLLKATKPTAPACTLRRLCRRSARDRSRERLADSVALPTRRGAQLSAAPHPFASSPLRHLLFAIRETAAADNSPEPGRQYLRDTFGQGYWGQRERFVGLLEWLAALGNAAGMDEWQDDSEAARILAGRLRNDHAWTSNMLQRHSSRENRLDHAVLNQRLEGAVSYDRIAGYFRSSLFEVAGEAIIKVAGPVRIICNSDLDPQDLVTAAAAQAALRRSWCSGRAGGCTTYRDPSLSCPL